MSHQFLVIQTAFIGDVVLATSLLENLHAAFPDARIDFLLRKGNEDLLKGHPFIREVLIWNKKEDKTRNLLRLVKVIRKKRYDKVINIQRYGATGMLTAFSGAGETIGFDKNPFSRLFSRKIKHVFEKGTAELHEIQRNHRLISHFVTAAPLRPRLYPSAEDYNRVAIYTPQPFFTISPASVWFTKQYPPGKWAALIDKLPGTHAVYLMGGKGDHALAEAIIRMTANRAAVNLCGELSFLQSAALMQKAALNYVNDSAPMHFASATNAPVAAVYCSTVPAFGYGPLSDTRFIIQREEPLYCRPCGLHGHHACPQGHFKCALDIRDEQLLVF